MSPSSVMKSLNRIASFQLQFDSLYIVPARTNLCPPASAHESSTVTIPVARKLTAPSDHNTLNRLASDVLQFGFVYPDTRILYSSKYACVGFEPFMAIRCNCRTAAQKTKEDRTHLAELNRLARLVELARIHDAPIYPSFNPPHLTNTQGRYSKAFPDPFASKLKSQLKLTSLRLAYPKTTIPKPIRYVKGHPIFEKSEFNSVLLVPKLQEANRFLKTTETPKSLPRLITSWICSLFKVPICETTPAPKKKVSAKPAKLEKTAVPLADRFVPATDVQLTLPKEPSPPPSPKKESVTISDADIILAIQPQDSFFHNDILQVSYLAKSISYLSSSSMDRITLTDLSKRLSLFRVSSVLQGKTYLDTSTSSPYDNVFLLIPSLAPFGVFRDIVAALVISSIDPNEVYTFFDYQKAGLSISLMRFDALRTCISDLSSVY
jgi:hypothetical protein